MACLVGNDGADVTGLAKHWETNNTLEQHVTLMRRQVQKSLDDPATIVLASSIISGNFDSMRDPRSGHEVPVVPYYGRWYRAAPSWDDVRTVCGQRDYRCAVVALWNFCVINFAYFQDSAGSDDYATLRATTERGGGDCDDLAIAFAALLKAVGFENIIFRIVSVHGDSWEHVYACVMLPDGTWLALDPTEKGHYPGWEYPNIAAKRDFAV